MNAHTLKQIAEYESMFDCSRGQIIDGIIDAQGYFKSKFKVAWMLKEPYNYEPEGWHIRDRYSGPDCYDTFFRNTAIPTWHTVIYTTFGIQNNFVTWNDIPYVRDKPELCQIVSTTAIINASKDPSPTGEVTYFRNLQEGFHKSWPIVKKQLEALVPDVLIFGNTFSLYKEYLQLENGKHDLRTGDKYVDVWKKDGQLFLNCYHPASRGNKENYVNGIIEAVKTFF